MNLPNTSFIMDFMEKIYTEWVNTNKALNRLAKAIEDNKKEV